MLSRRALQTRAASGVGASSSGPAARSRPTVVPTVASAAPTPSQPTCKAQRSQLYTALKRARSQVEAVSSACATSPAVGELAQRKLDTLKDRLERLATVGYLDDLPSSSSDEEDTDISSCMLVERRASSSSSSSSSATATTISRPRSPAPTLAPMEQQQRVFDAPDITLREYEGVGRVLVCTGSKCLAKGGGEVFRAVSAAAANSLGVAVLPCKCLGKCSAGAAMRVKVEGLPRCSVHTRLQALDAVAILDEAFMQPVPPATPEPAPAAPPAAAIAAHSDGQQADNCCTDCKTHP